MFLFLRYAVGDWFGLGAKFFERVEEPGLPKRYIIPTNSMKKERVTTCAVGRRVSPLRVFYFHL